MRLACCRRTLSLQQYSSQAEKIHCAYRIQLDDEFDTLNVNCVLLFELQSDDVSFACNDEHATPLSRFVDIESAFYRICTRFANASARLQWEFYENHVELKNSAFINLLQDSDGNMG